MSGNAQADEVTEYAVTYETYVELGKPAGIGLVSKSNVEAGGLYVCAGYVLGEPFMLPGNVVRSCNRCGCLLQERPHAPEKVERICMPCAVVAGLTLPGPAPKISMHQLSMGTPRRGRRR